MLLLDLNTISPLRGTDLHTFRSVQQTDVQRSVESYIIDSETRCWKRQNSYDASQFWPSWTNSMITSKGASVRECTLVSAKGIPRNMIGCGRYRRPTVAPTSFTQNLQHARSAFYFIQFFNFNACMQSHRLSSQLTHLVDSFSYKSTQHESHLFVCPRWVILKYI